MVFCLQTNRRNNENITEVFLDTISSLQEEKKNPPYKTLAPTTYPKAPKSIKYSYGENPTSRIYNETQNLVVQTTNTSKFCEEHPRVVFLKSWGKSSQLGY